MNSLWSITLATLRKDIRLEWRSKDALNSMLFFSLLVVVIFSFSFDPLAEESRHIVGGLIWVAFLFAAVVALNQTWSRELRNQVLDAYRVSPAPANALFLAKALGNFIFVSVLEGLMTPLFVPKSSAERSLSMPLGEDSTMRPTSCPPRVTMKVGTRRRPSSAESPGACLLRSTAT